MTRKVDLAILLGMKTLRSMTGYGRAFLQKEGVQLVVEILSVNRKHLDINMAMPKYLLCFDPEIRKKLSQTIFRGHITVRISAAFQEESPLLIKPNLALIEQLYQGWNAIGKHLKLPGSSFDLSLLERESDLFVFEENPEALKKCQALILEGVDEALKPFLEMRLKEGEAIQRDIQERLKVLREKVTEIGANSKDASEKQRAKLLQKMKEVLPSVETTDERLLKEIALFAEKVDIAEEIVRFQSHLDQFETLLTSGQETAGKTAEFLVQELGREINTMGSKTSDYAVSHLVITVKGELERIREQIQNVE